MRLIERLQAYLMYNHISAYAFEHDCQLANGYLGKQLKGKGSVGSDILLRIKEKYSDLSLVWLVTGEGPMLLSVSSKAVVFTENNGKPAQEQPTLFATREELIQLLKKQIVKLERTILDKERIIFLQEEQIRQGAIEY